MYSVVLMAAMTASAEAPAFGNFWANHCFWEDCHPIARLDRVRSRISTDYPALTQLLRLRRLQLRLLFGLLRLRRMLWRLLGRVLWRLLGRFNPLRGLRWRRLQLLCRLAGDFGRHRLCGLRRLWELRALWNCSHLFGAGLRDALFNARPIDVTPREGCRSSRSRSISSRPK